MTITPTHIKDLVILEPKIHRDDRGYFFESFSWKIFSELTGHQEPLVQDNQARSTRNVLRGLHFQNPPSAQSKLVRVLEGSIWDVAVDIRSGSPTFGQWFGIELTAENKKQLFVPRGFAHGYSVLSEHCEIMYKCDNYYDKSTEGGIIYNDPSLNIDWKIDLKDALVSEKDLVQPQIGSMQSLF